MNEGFSVLDRYGEDFTKKTYITNPAIGREKQIQELLLILLTPEKSAILIGKPGIGKTAIVEGLAWRIQKGEVPDALKGYTIINIKTASLLGTMPNGESKVQIMIDELKTKDKVILFVDEVHMLIGATDSSSLDFANIFKEGLGRGSIKVIGATTTEEYERYILRDKAFTRRFQKVEVPEPTRDETVQIMMGTLPKIENDTNAKMKYTSFVQSQLMGFIVDCTSEYKRVFAIGSRYPDIALTLLKQAFSRAVFENRKEVTVFDVRAAIENSKNIYPDVIKKELPHFDEMFKDIIKEERGEETGLEWKHQVETKPLEEKQPEPVKEVKREEAKIVLEKPRVNFSENKEAKLPKNLKKDFAMEADKMLLSGKMNEITENGFVLNKDSIKSIHKYGEMTRLPSAELDQLDQVAPSTESVLPGAIVLPTLQLPIVQITPPVSENNQIVNENKQIANNDKTISETKEMMNELETLLKPVSIYDPNETSVAKPQQEEQRTIPTTPVDLTLNNANDDKDNPFDDFFEEE